MCNLLYYANIIVPVKYTTKYLLSSVKALLLISFVKTASIFSKYLYS